MTRISLLEKIYGHIPGRVDVVEFRVSYDHASCSYGQPVLVLADPADSQMNPDLAGSAFGPGDTGPIQVSERSKHFADLVAAGYDCTLETLPAGPMDP